ncbi:DUF4158 domain-containing protein [Streptosporangium canum]|uniref:DUF4158 domain-containing protein n=1 Tax=Streptosporangium canum TaxID=324952 RepID=UPI0036C9F1B1
MRADSGKGSAASACSRHSPRRTAERHRAQIRTFLDFSERTVADAGRLTDWLARQVCERARRADRVREALAAQLRDERLERPTRLRLSQMIGSALSRSETALTTKIASRIPAEAVEWMLTLIVQRTVVMVLDRFRVPTVAGVLDRGA